MVFFAIIMLAVLFLQDTKKHTYELLHTKPVTAGKYVMGKVSAGFTICLLVLTILNILFWVLCRIFIQKIVDLKCDSVRFYSFYRTLYIA